MKQVSIRAGGGYPGTDGIFEHIAGTAGILADHDVRMMLPAVVPPEKAPDFIGVNGGQIFVGFPAKAVGSKIFCHVHSIRLIAETRSSPFLLS